MAAKNSADWPMKRPSLVKALTVLMAAPSVSVGRMIETIGNLRSRKIVGSGMIRLPCPVSDLFGLRGRQLLARLGLPEPWQTTIEASLRLIDELEREIGDCERELRGLGADHRYVPRLLTGPGIGWVLAYTIAAEIGDIGRFPGPRKLAG